MKSVFGLLLCPFLLSALSYNVEFVGMDNARCLKELKDASDLITLQDRPPASVNGLRYRVESDLPSLMKILRVFAYYDASITYNIDASQDPVQVTLFVRAGQPFKLSSYQVFHGLCKDLAAVPDCSALTADDLGLTLGKPPTSVAIVNAELQVLTELSRCGYPLAYIDKRKVEVDMDKKEINAAVCVQEGPLSKFGPSFLFGLKGIHPRYIERRITWSEGDVYDSDLVAETQKSILKTDLFSSVYISHGQKLDEIGELPMQIRMTEAKHRQISVGAYYATADGPGGSLSWTHRNVRGMGEIAHVEGDLSKRYLAGLVSYKKPDFLVQDQTYTILGAISREKIHPYIAFSYRFANYLDRQIDEKHTFSAGLKIEHINVSSSATNGTYLLMGLPLLTKYDASDNKLDPTQGYTFTYQATPYQSLFHAHQRFIKQRVTMTFYFPLTPKRMFVLALRGQVGSIAGAKQKYVPLTKLFLGGTEDDLRGYRYMSVSPLDSGNKSLGGRSAIFATTELRIRIKQFGVVPFADFGTVTLSEFPQVSTKWFKSVGVGLRYFAFFGPLRVDVGFPLDRRVVDPPFRIYASVGQSF